MWLCGVWSDSVIVCGCVECGVIVLLCGCVECGVIVLLCVAVWSVE